MTILKVRFCAYLDSLEVVMFDLAYALASAPTMEGFEGEGAAGCIDIATGLQVHGLAKAQAPGQPGPPKTTETGQEAAYKTPEPQADEQPSGLPIRQWRQQMVNIAPPSEREETKKEDQWDEELPHGMPKDTHLLTPHCQELLKLVRSGKLYKKRPLPEEEDTDADGISGEKSDKKDSGASDGYGFQVRKWVRLERSAEDAGINLLAPRHKNTITRPSKQLATQVTGPMVTKATVKRLDAAGNPYMQEVIVPEGQAIDGEIISTSVVPAPEATGEAVLPVATPARRKPPIPQKKKGRGRGRGAKGRGRLPLPTPSLPVPQQDGSTEAKPENVGSDVSMQSLRLRFICLTSCQGVKIKSENASGARGDLEMNEPSALDEDDGDETFGDDEDGDGDESGTPAVEGEDQEMRDAPAYPPSDSAAETTQPGANLVPPLLVTGPVQLEGSPLKNVTLRSPTDPSPHLSPIATTATTAASADAVLSGVPGESTLGLLPSVPEPQQPVLLSQAFFRGDDIDRNPAEPLAPVSGPPETNPEDDFNMKDVPSTNTESQGPCPEPSPTAEGTAAAPVVETTAPVEPFAITEPPSVPDAPHAVGAAPMVEPTATVDPPAVAEPSPGVPPPLQDEKLPTAPAEEDIPVPSSEEPMPGQAVEMQQVPVAIEPGPPPPVIAPVPAPAPSPPPVAQVPAEEMKDLLEDVGTSDVKTVCGGADLARADGEGVADEVVQDEGSAGAAAETAEDAGAKDTVITDGARSGETGTQDVVTEDAGTEEGVTEDGSFDILGSLSTSLNQQAEDDVPPPPLPSAPTDTTTAEPAVQPNGPAPAAQPDESGLSGQAGEAAGTAGESVQMEQSSDLNEGGSDAQIQDLPERPGEDK
jgi:hypothetical protein